MENRNKKAARFIILISMTLFLITGIGVVLAAYTFYKNVSNDVDAGQVKVDSKKFVSYQNSTDSTMRVDTVFEVDDISLITSTEYSTTTDTTFQSTKVYYVTGTYKKAAVNVGDTIPLDTYYEDKNGGYNLTSDTKFDSSTSYYIREAATGYTKTSSIVIGGTINGTYYEALATHSGIVSIGSITDPSSSEITYSISSTDKKVVSFTKGSEVTTVTITEFDSIGIKEATTDNENYSVIVSPDQLGFVVIDDRLTKGVLIEGETITCSATEKKQNQSSIYLNQLGFEFAFTNEIAVYVRVHIMDAWILTRKYATATRETYSIKDQISGNSPFAISDSNWFYNAEENTAYLKTMILPSLDENNEYLQQSYRFNVNPAYFYTNSKTTVYTEYVDVEVSFTVELIQANRAMELWKVDPSTLGSE